MNIEDKIFNNCRKGVFTVVKNMHDRYCVFTPIYLSEDHFMRGSWQKSIKMAKLFVEEAVSKKDLKGKTDDWKIVETYRLEPQEKFEHGDKVLVSEDYDDPKIAGEVIKVGLYDEDHDTYAIMHGEREIAAKHLIPHYWEEETVEIDGQEYTKKMINDALDEYFDVL